MSEQWYRDEQLWDMFYDCMFAAEDFERGEREVEVLLERVPPGRRRVLDLGCGPGRHALPLARRGLEVTALDTSETLLGRVRSSAAAEGLAMEIVNADMREFSRPVGYDLVLSMWTSFGYFDAAGNRRVLERCAANLCDGGALVLDLVGKEYLLQHLEPVHLREYDDARLLIERPALVEEMTRLSNQWILIDGERAVCREWDHEVFTGRELRDCLHAAGFGPVRLYGSLAGTPYDTEAERLIAVACRHEGAPVS